MMRIGLTCPAGRSWLRWMACQNCRMKMPPDVPGRVVARSIALRRAGAMRCARDRRDFSIIAMALLLDRQPRPSMKPAGMNATLDRTRAIAETAGWSMNPTTVIDRPDRPERAMASLQDRIAMHNSNTLKLGLFGANCSNGRAMTRAPERWPADWDSCERLAEVADAAGIDFMLPIGRWKGYRGETDHQGTTLESITWACGLLARTRRMTVFATVHVPLLNPVMAAKQIVTADLVGHGRFGLNIVVGWNDDEFQMFGIAQREPAARYEYGQEWIDAVKRMWGPEEEFSFEGRYLKLRNVRMKPKPYGGTRPLIMNAGVSQTGRGYALRNCDAL